MTISNKIDPKKDQLGTNHEKETSCAVLEFYFQENNIGTSAGVHECSVEMGPI
jgi:hypothetical protein